MRYAIDNDMHIHTYLSKCSNDPTQNAQTILEHAKKHGLKTIVITDHFWDNLVKGWPTSWYQGQDFENISKVKPLPQADGIKFLFGCETEMSGNLVIGLDKSHFDEFDFIVIPTTHLHMGGNVLPLAQGQALTHDHIAKTWIEKLDALLNCDLPFHKVGIAHLTCSLIYRSTTNEYQKVLDLIPTEKLKELFTKASSLGVGIEINSDDFKNPDRRTESVLRIYRIAKECGCKFYLASDAHHPQDLENSIDNFNYAIDALGLTENDKFHL
jgi:histidinol phosphatase-like PHP family hydrolase